MQRLIDFYSDGGALLRETVSFEELPDFVKVASYVGGQALDPSDYAVVLLERGSVQPALPRNDPGNTAISTHYLLQQADELPDEIVKLAANNLAVACKGFGMDIPAELLKLADLGGDPGLLRDRLPYVEITGLKNHKEAEKRRALPTKAAKIKKDRVADAGAAETKLKTSAVKEAAKIPGLKIPGGKVAFKSASGATVAATKPAMTTVAKPAAIGKAKVANLIHVQHAAEHFNSSWKKIHPLDRVKLAQALVPDARALGVPLVPEAYAYASGVMDLGRAEIAIQTRQVLSSGHPIYGELQKIAADCTSVELVEALWQADEATGLSRFWNSRIDDPFLSVMKPPLEKTAEPAEETRFQVGGGIVTDTDLQQLCRRRDLLIEQFGESFCNEFCKNPTTVFKSMPDTTKEILARMARDPIGAVKDHV